MMLTTHFLVPRPSSSSSTASTASTSSSMSSSPSTSSEACAVCGDAVNGKRYGAPACLGCIVFFRRAVINKSQYKCWKKGNCVITFASRCVCRCCRLRKCFHVGMKPEAIQRRDLLGPRKPKTILTDDMSQSIEVALNFSPSPPQSSCESDNGDLSVFDIDALVHLQRDQRSQHEAYSIHQIDTIGCVQMKSTGKYHRRARAHDINFVLKLGLENANEWGNQFEPYRNLSQRDKNMVLSEFGFGFLLIDQGYKTAQRADDGFWILQNDTFMHPNYFFALSEEDAKKENAQKKAEFHYSFVNELVKCVSDPFKKLRIDEFECAILKTVLLLTPSFPGQVVYKDVEYLHNKCMSELMEHSAQKSPDNGAERFGEIILLVSSIRCAVKAIYNHTRVSDIFHLMTFDPCVRNIFLN
ncbi:Protein CBR-NHR-181 [Caenorhabditis briggsae]|uniref:Protein CBR-NHR-181 n=1 Tax=Caenorhabditis briggsae TaxID=6238 RepID=A8XB18_CAEBR|nr:Protein CBR-NHR-181 [Caenorhabditis briggsae]CAP29798.2 Protein CBR-NHR-181 [Caenorhabditis briggsae]